MVKIRPVYKMSYTPPREDLTAKLMYDKVDALINKHAKKDIETLSGGDIEGLVQESSDLGRLRLKPEIKGGLEEFAYSYFFTGLNAPLPGFEEIFRKETTDRQEKLKDYMRRLEEQYGDEANEEISRLFGELKRRGEKLSEEIPKIMELKKNKLIQQIAYDAFNNLAGGYQAMIELLSIDIKS